MTERALRGGLQRFRALAVRVSNLPSYESFSWGPKRSWAAWSLYHFIFLLRFASILQWWKACKRSKYKPLGHSKLDEKARPDFHASDSELYLFAVFLFSLSAFFASPLLFRKGELLAPAYMPVLDCVGRFVIRYFLVESILWTFYYALLRPLIERAKLNLYDEAEYFVMLPVVILTQSILCSILWDKSLGQTGLLLLNVSDPQAAQVMPDIRGILTTVVTTRSQALFAALLGQSYIVIIIANLIRVIPPLDVRKRPNIVVVGYGDVVQKRILPALRAVYQPRQLAVASDYLSAEDKARLRAYGIEPYSAYEEKPDPNVDTAGAIEKIVSWVDSRSKFAIVAVKTPYHLNYILQMANRGIRFAVEKPLVGNSAELDLLSERSSSHLFADIFVFGYYWLEKGLSANYLLTLNPNYRGLLDLKPQKSMQEMAFLLSQLGRLRELTMEFLEGPETLNRYWSELPANGGMVMETLVHPMTFVVQFARQAKAFSPVPGLWAAPPIFKWRKNARRAQEIREQFQEEIGPTFVEISGVLNHEIPVNLRCGKYIVPKGSESRLVVAKYERGSIVVDLSKMATSLFLGDSENVPALTISNKKTLKSQSMRNPDEGVSLRYQSQVDLLNTFFNDGWGGLRFDDYPSQIEVLRELFKIANAIPDIDSIPDDEDIDSRSWINLYA